MKFNNRILTDELVKCKSTKKVSKELVELWQHMINTEWTKRYPKNHPLCEDCKSEAMLVLLKTAFNFDNTKSDNGYAFCTIIIVSAFIQTLHRDKSLI